MTLPVLGRTGICLFMLFMLISSCSSNVSQQVDYTLAAKSTAYAQRYGKLAVREMKLTGIPASIKLAQAMVESGYGESMLAQRGNNHFGVKCHGWQGKKVFFEDSGENSCFRVYPSVASAYTDHSRFLLQNKRYRFLFGFNPRDYRAWAHGLKQAGYATDPQYEKLLIGVIERNALYRYDRL